MGKMGIIKLNKENENGKKCLYSLPIFDQHECNIWILYLYQYKYRYMTIASI